MWCGSTLKGISFKVLAATLEIPEIFKFSVLDAGNAVGTFLLREGLRTLLQPKTSEAKSSEEFTKLNDALGFLDFAVAMRLRRVTKRPTDGR